MTTPPLKITGVTHTFPDGLTRRVVLDCVNLELKTGELVAIMGRSGSGKSTLLNIASGLTTPDHGVVEVNGTALTKTSASARAKMRRTKFGIVHQRNNLIAALNARENIAFPHELNGTKPVVANAIAQLALESQGLERFADLFPNQLSGGQRQLVAILAALSGDRGIILADEPTGALDSGAGDTVMQLIRKKIDQGSSGLIVTHDARDAAWADRIIYLSDGMISSDTGTFDPEISTESIGGIK